MALKIIGARNDRAKAIVAKFIQNGDESPLSATERRSLTNEFAILERLIPVNAKGFRGVVITGLVGMMLDGSYRPTEDFYRCNPRPIFEQGIYYALVEARIPCGKSDPLNVAKNIQKLDYDWARGRRPEPAARAAVDYLRIIEQAWTDQPRRELVIRAFFERLLEYRDFVNRSLPAIAEKIGQVPIVVANSLAAFAIDCPEGGTMPQFIVGNLIRRLREGDPRYLLVGGVDESVFGTNTTSKKPADVWEVLADGTLGELYEITVKKIDFKRLDDCVDAMIQTGIASRPITFVCNIPDDIQTLGISENHFIYQGVGFQFLDITSFIRDIFCIIGAEGQMAIVELLQEFVSETTRQMKTKAYWSEVLIPAMAEK